MIECAKWRELEDYRDPKSGEEKAYGIRISGDGVLSQITLIVDRETPQAKEVLGHMKEMGYKV